MSVLDVFKSPEKIAAEKRDAANAASLKAEQARFDRTAQHLREAEALDRSRWHRGPKGEVVAGSYTGESAEEKKAREQREADYRKYQHDRQVKERAEFLGLGAGVS